MEVTENHLNTLGVVHGGVLFALCDQAVGAWLVYKKKKGFAMDGSIHYYRPAQRNDILTATATERKSGEKAGVFFVELLNQDNKRIADAIVTAIYFEHEYQGMNKSKSSLMLERMELDNSQFVETNSRCHSVRNMPACE